MPSAALLPYLNRGSVRPVHRILRAFPFFPGLLAAATLGAAPVSAFAQDHAPAGEWTAAWIASPCGSAAGPQQSDLALHNETIREIVRITLGGSAVRIRIANTFGTERLTFGGGGISERADGSRVRAQTSRSLTFNGQTSVVIPPGAYLLSDPIAVSVKPLSELAVSLYVPSARYIDTLHYEALQTTYLAPGNQAAALDLAGVRTITKWPFLTAVEVSPSHPGTAVVALGSSITDGHGSTPGSYHRWTDVLAERLVRDPHGQSVAVLNAGIGGNRVLHNGEGASGPAYGEGAVARFDRDVLAQAGVGFVVLFEGQNDINMPGSAGAPASEIVTSQDLIAGFTQLAERAHEHGIRAIGGTLTAFEGASHTTPGSEQIRQRFNSWIRTSPLLDGFIDFDRATLDPSHPARLFKAYDSGDHLHLSDAGYRAMAEAIDLKLFTSPPPR